MAMQKNPFALHAAAWRTNLNELLEQLANGADVARRDKVILGTAIQLELDCKRLGEPVPHFDSL